METTIQALRDQGIYLKKEWIDSTIRSRTGNTESISAEEIYNLVIQKDIKTYSEGCLNKLTPSSQNYTINHIIVLQIESITNIASPSDTQYTDTSNRMLKIELSDGPSFCYAIEFSPIPALSVTLMKGTKIAIHNVSVHNGLLLLNASNCTVLGGRCDTG